MTDIFDTLLLLALPASGKSEVRRFLELTNPEELHMGPTVQLDDYPYVHLQLVVDEILEALGQPRAYHETCEGARNGPFMDGRELGALGILLAEDYDEIRRGTAERPERAAERLLQRFDQASVAAGARAKLESLSPEVRAQLCERLEPQARELFDDKAARCPSSLAGKTVVIEFARGAPEGSTMPPPDGYGYIGTLRHMSAGLLERAAILYVWVTPEESRRKNRARARPGADDSILFHGVPEVVMRREYGSCDMAHLIATADKPGTITVEAHGRTFHVPTARFDNRQDLTSFLHADQSDWQPEQLAAISQGMRAACEQLWETYRAHRGG